MRAIVECPLAVNSIGVHCQIINSFCLIILFSTDVGVFFCGPQGLSHTLHTLCDQYGTLQEGMKFVYNKENF